MIEYYDKKIHFGSAKTEDYLTQGSSSPRKVSVKKVSMVATRNI